MGVGLGWKRVAPQFPYVDGEVWNDGISRSGNKISFSFNVRLVLPTSYGYWNYAWYLNIKCGDVEVFDKKVKNLVYRNDFITGVEYWYSTFNGNFTGQITVDGRAQTVPVTVTFHDSNGNWGEPQTWYVPIPTASSMSAVKSTVSVTGPSTADISGWVNSNGAYSTITGWRLSYGINGYNENVLNNDSSALSSNWSLSNLQPATYYMYKIEVWNSAGYSQSYTGNFRTEDNVIGDLVVNGQPIKALTGWIIRPDGQIQRIKEVRKVVG